MMLYSVKSCCCGCSLKQGTHALLILSLISSALSVIRDFSHYYVSFTMLSLDISTLIISIAGLYGSDKQKPAYIVPFMVSQFFGLIFSLFVLMILLIEQTLFIMVLDYLSEIGKLTIKAEDLAKMDGIFFVAILMVGFLSGVQYHFITVVHSYYKELKENTRAPSAFP